MITESEIHYLVDGFRNHTLPKEDWTHQAHLINGLFCVMREGVEASIPLMREGIKSYNLSVGTENTDTGGYHESITVLFVHALQAFRNQIGLDLPLIELVNRFDGSPLMENDFIFWFYSKDLVFSVKARREWVEPDILPLD